MTGLKTAQRGRVAEVMQRLGKCLELVPMDPNFHDISVGLYVKNGTNTLWTYSQTPGVEERIRQIRDQLGALGGMEPVEGTHDQARYSCGQLHVRPTKFLVKQAVEKPPDYRFPEGGVKDLRSPLMLDFDVAEADDRWVYTVTCEGDAPDPAARLRAVTGGLGRYGDMEKVADHSAAFACGHRHDQLTRVVLPYARNVSAVEDMLDAEALRGQMTTATLGFTPPT